MNLKYPESAIKEKKEGKVFLRFVVTKTGEVDKIGIVRSLQTDCDNEAIRVAKMLPKFIPGTDHGKPESRWYILPLIFKLPTIDHTDVILNQKFKPDHIFDVVEQMPEFPGGISALLSFIDKNITKSPLAGGLNYKVFCRMVIEKDGSVSNITVIKSVDSECDKEAVRVLKLLPKFIPAKYNGQNVRAYYIIPVSLENK
jgi:TonB family protein